MPYAVTHVIITIILLDIFRDYIIKNKKAIPLHFVLVGGIAGLLPDIDYPLLWMLRDVFGMDVSNFHRLFTHNIFLVLIPLIAGLILYRHHKEGGIVLFITSYGIFMHLLLDFLLAGTIMPFYPFSTYEAGLGLVSNLGVDALMGGIDAIILVLWLAHEEIKHKIRDYI